MQKGEFIDLRSDTVTAPTAEMRNAIARAAVGDDYYGDDPTVRELEEKAANRLAARQHKRSGPPGTLNRLQCTVEIVREGQRGR